MVDKENLVCVGQISVAHGIKGQVKIKSFTADAGAIAEFPELYDQAGNGYKIRVTSRVKDVLIAWVEGIRDRTQAESLKGKKLYVVRDMLPEEGEDEFYYEDVIGLPVFTTEGASIGIVKAFHNYGASDIIEITLSDTGKDIMYPFTKDFVPEVNIEEGKVVINPPEIVIGKKE